MRFSLSLRVFPQSRAEALEVADGVVRVRLTAPAIEGKANEACLRLLAKTLKIPKSALTIARGEHGRNKIIFVEADSLPEPYLLLAKQTERKLNNQRK